MAFASAPRRAGLALLAALASVSPALAQPIIDAVDPPAFPTAGGVVITIEGRNFGAAGGVVRLGGQPVAVAPGPDWSDVRIRLPLPEGDPGPVELRVMPNGMPPSAPFGAAYFGPELFDALPPSGPAAGGFVVTLTGRNFGTDAATRVVTFGPRWASCRWLGHEALEVTTPNLPPGTVVPIRLEINGIAAANEIAYAVAAPSIGGFEPESGPTQGGIPITIHGSNFGASPEDPLPIVHVGTAQAADVERLGPSEIRCLLPPGSGTNRVLSVQVGSAPPAPSASPFRYLPPVVAAVDPPSGPAFGGVRLTIHGANFGPPGSPREAWIAPVSGGPGTSIAIDPAATTHERIVGDLPPSGAGDYALEVLVDGQWSNAVPWSIASPPVITALSSENGPTTGGVPLTIHGQGFGADPGLVELGPWPCPVTAWTETEIACTTPAGWSGSFQVIVKPPNHTPSAGRSYTYDRPLLFEVDPDHLDPAGGTVITLRGENFGIEGSPLAARLGGGGPDLAILEWRGHHEIVVLSGPGPAGGASILCVRVPGSGLGEDCRPVTFGNPVGVEPLPLPAAFGLRLAGANPSRGATAFAVDLPRAARFGLDVFDSSGRLVRRFAEDAAAGMRVVRWDGADARGARAPAGLYWARLEVGGKVFVRRAIRL